MTRRNRIALAVFFGALLGCVASVAAFDAWVAIRWGTGATISWSMALLAHRYPFLSFAVGHVTGGVVWGLAAHFWASQPPVADADLAGDAP